MGTSNHSKFSIGLILGICLLLFLVLQCPSWAAERKTEIIIIGTVHKETQNFHIQDLVSILNKVKPDVILFEFPADMMTPSFEFKTVMKDSLEQQAVLEYVKKTGAKIRPYDIEGRNAFLERADYFAQQSRCNQELTGLANKKKLNSEAQKVYDLLIAAYSKREKIGDLDPSIINSFASDTAINENLWLMTQGIPEITRLTPELRGCEAFWDLFRAYWIRRNNQMIANIKRYGAEFAGQRLVVLCGYEHRCYLRSHLYDWRDDPPNYIVKEFWQY
jgi:hypothetical protein